MPSGLCRVIFFDAVDDSRDGVGTTGDSLVAALALPDTDGLALDGVLSAEGADVAGVLGDFHLLHLLTQGGTVSIQGKGGQYSDLRDCRSFFGRFSFRNIMIVRRRGRGEGVQHTWYRIYR